MLFNGFQTITFSQDIESLEAITFSMNLTGDVLAEHHLSPNTLPKQDHKYSCYSQAFPVDLMWATLSVLSITTRPSNLAQTSPSLPSAKTNISGF